VKSLTSSFRDPSGFVFKYNEKTYRQINKCFANEFESFISSGLYSGLIEKGLLISHEDVNTPDIPYTENCHRIILPKQIPYISYPYEWSFSQLKDAAILTLKVQAQSLKYGFSLKDASSYNVQFIGNKLKFIDTLSFQPYKEGEPWIAYRQFCQHFLAPLALMAYVDIELAKLLSNYIDGVPLSLASKLLPNRTRLNYGLQIHLHLHAKIQKAYSDSANPAESNTEEKNKAKLTLKGQRAIIEDLASVINRLEWKLPKTEWGDYYANTNYDDQSSLKKRELVNLFIQGIPDKLNIVQDLGANTGEFSRIASNYCDAVIAQDIDPVAVERNYLRSKSESPSNILPLVQNLIAPSPAIGWANKERDSFVQRATCDGLLALALIHHLTISNNTPLSHVAKLFAQITTWLVIEFVPKSDSQVARLLATREDIFEDYTETGFEAAFLIFFTIQRKELLSGSDRVLYLMKSDYNNQESNK
tara:strand:+ start:1044 stop:2465 length:1422 start_codon:yes stop_codon:yes gene_type:complete